MPELPEVETIKRELRPKIVHQKIKDCTILRKDIIGFPSPHAFYRGIIGESITNVNRKGKYLIIELTNGKKLIFHLRLSGAITLKEQHEPSGRFDRLILKLTDYEMCFEEPRVLGRAYLVNADEKPDALKGFFGLGHEPICAEFDLNYLKSKIKNRKAHIKSLLLDQYICAGVGNIYSDEALFLAGVRPLRRAHSLKTHELFKLVLALKDVINKGIENFGTTVSDYKRTDGKSGNFQNSLHVYSRENEPCRKCGTKIIFKKMGNRRTRYCPKCQK